LLALTSLLIASKIEDLCPLSITQIVQEIGGNKYQPVEILALEK
jgi:hypothetical protein